VPFSSEATEYNALRSPPASGLKIDVGYLPLADAPRQAGWPQPDEPGHEPAPGYTLRRLYIWRINYFVMNFQAAPATARSSRQLYFRRHWPTC